MSCKFRPGGKQEPGKKAEATGQSKYLTTVRMGPRGQIVIPKEARELFDHLAQFFPSEPAAPIS